MATPQTQESKKSPGIEIEEAPKKAIPDYLAKEVLTTFEEVAKFKGWYRQPSNKDRRPCLVDSSLFELITEGDIASPFIWLGDNKSVSVPIVDADRKDEAFQALSGGKRVGF